MSTTPSQIISNPSSDIRSFAKEARRDVDQKMKWARGGRCAPGKTCSYGMEVLCICTDRPGRKPGRRSPRERFDGPRKGTVRQQLNTADDLFNPSSDLAAHEYTHELVAALHPGPEAEVMYSYDAAQGPAKGNHILSLAITKAVERYESQETEKIAKEYEFVDGKENDESPCFADDDGFEIVSHGSF